LFGIAFAKVDDPVTRGLPALHPQSWQYQMRTRAGMTVLGKKKS
jgi:hypothetical protein